MKSMKERLKENEPYNVFFTTISNSPPTHSQQNSITFTDLLCPSLGELKCSLQVNFMVDVDWLMEQYGKVGQAKKPLTILYGDKDKVDMPNKIENLYPNVTGHYVQMKDDFGLHHAKFGIYIYNDYSLRVVVSTTNLNYNDWNRYCNGLWISPLCPALPDDSSDRDGESPTIFKSTLINYLQQYKLDMLGSWINYIKRADFSNIRVFLTTSVPGSHRAVSRHCHLHTVGKLLSKYCVLPISETEDSLSWSILAQSSSIGSFGREAEWLRGTLMRSLASHKKCSLPANSSATISVVYPTKNNVLESYYGKPGGNCLSYREALSNDQKWLENYLYQWKADYTNRSRAIPHLKTYCRVSPCMTKLAWFLLTSANTSRSAWGGNITKKGTYYVRSYEVGVLFLPTFFDEAYFQVKGSDDQTRLFPFIYDLPLTPYSSSDEPWYT